MLALRWVLISLTCLLLLACPSQRPQDDDDDDDDDDDSAVANDDDATPGDDDDATAAPLSPEIVGLEVCQQTVVLGSFALFQIEVTDEQDDLLAPVAYQLRIDTAANITYQWPQSLGGHGWIDHTVQLGQGTLVRGSEHTFSFTVLDDAGNASVPAEQVWSIPLDPDAEACD